MNESLDVNKSHDAKKSLGVNESAGRAEPGVKAARLFHDRWKWAVAIVFTTLPVL